MDCDTSSTSPASPNNPKNINNSFYDTVCRCHDTFRRSYTFRTQRTITVQSANKTEDELTVAGDKHIMTPKETAQYLRKSLSWVYKNSAALGGRKLGGSLFFPAREDLYERIFCKREGVEVRIHPHGNQAYGNLVQNENRGQTIRGRKKKGD